MTPSYHVYMCFEKKEMERKLYAYTVMLVLLGVITLNSCTTTREREVEDELGDFRAWVNKTTSNIANRTEDDWKKAKEDFRMRTQELDQKQERFSQELKQEYSQLKQEFSEADEAYGRNRSEARMAEWEQRLLGNWADLETVNEGNVLNAYTTLLENVRAQKGNWSDKDWEMAKLVLEKLDERRKELTGNIDTETEVKIRALQMEFRTLETGADISD